MWKPALVGAVAFATTVASLAPTGVRADESVFQRQHVRVGALISDAQIDRFKAALRLTAEQERHWPAVAAELRRIRLGVRAAAFAADSFGLRRLVSAAKPLFYSLDDNQKRVALQLVQSLGFGAFAAAL
jgi:hypothetical protein